MSSQNDMLKKDILEVLSKEISGGGDVRTAYPNSNVPKTDFGLAGAVKKPAKSKAKKNPAKAKAKKNPAKQPKKDPEPRIDPLHQVSKEEAKKSKPVKKPAKKNVGSFLSMSGEGTVGGRRTIYYDKEEGFEAFYDGKVPKFYQTDKLINETSNPKYKKEWIDSISAPSSKPTHKMPDGSIHTGKTHTKDSKVVKPAPKIPKKIQDKIDKATSIKELEQIKKDYGTKSKPAPKNTPQYQKLLDRTKARKAKKQAKTAPPISVSKTGKITKQNPWLEHVKQYRFNNNVEGMSVAEVNKEARKTYTPKSKEPKKKSGRTGIQRGVVRVKTAPKKKSGRTGIQKVEQTDEQLMQKVINTVAELEGSDELTDEQLEEKILLIVAEKQLENMKPKERKKYERAKTKPPLTPEDIKALSKPKKECPPGKELNVLTNRCKKIIKKRKTKGTSPWHAFLRKFRAENPQIKGKDVMKEASKQYELYGDVVPVDIDYDSEATIEVEPEGLDDDDLDEDAVELDGSLYLDNRLVKVPDKTTNQILADVLDSFDAMIKTLQNVANSDIRKTEKEKEFNVIADRVFEFYEKLPFVQLDPLSRKRVDDAFDHITDIITNGYKDLKSGIDVVEYREYEDDDTVEAIIDNELLIPASVLDQYVSIREEENRRQEEAREPLVTDTVNLNSKDNLPVELQVDFEDADEEFSDDDDIYDLGYDEELPVRKVSYKELEKGVIQDFNENIKQTLQEEERKQQLIKLRVEDIYMEDLEKRDKEIATQEALKRIRERKQLYARNAELYGEEREFTERDLDDIIREVEEDYIGDYDLDFLPDDPETDEEGVYITEDTMLAMLDEEEDQDLQYSRKPSNYPNNVLTDENSIQPTSIENTNMSAPRISRPSAAPRLPTIIEEDEEEKKPKRKRPLNLRLYQEFLKQMRKYDPSLSRADITALWRSNKDAYIDMLMETVDLSGGNLLNPEHYFNAFRNIGGVMLGGSCCEMCEGGVMGNKYYQMKHADTGFDRTSYDTVNNPYGIGKTHADAQPRLPQVSAPSTTTPTYSGSDIDMTDLSDPRAWGKTFENIASGVYDGLKDVYKILSPLSWIF
jgi:hypothetical protein